MIYLVLLLAGLAAIFWIFDQLELRAHRKGMVKCGDGYKPTVDVMRIGYFVMFAYFAILSLALSDGQGTSDYYDPCGSSMRC